MSVAFVVACGDRAPAVQTNRVASERPTASPVVATEALPAAAPNSPSARESTRPDAAKLAALRRAVAEGRRLVRARSHAEASAAFERALTLDPGSPRLRCEAGYVAYLAEDLPRAERYVTLALRSFGDVEDVPERLHVPVAMCLYNVGLVLQTLGRRPAAAEAFERSLALRENTAVRARLQALGAGTGRGATTPTETSADVRERAQAYLCSLGEELGDGTCRLRASDEGRSGGTLVAIEERTPSGSPPGGFTASLAIATATYPLAGARAIYLDVHFGETSLAGRLAEEFNAGMGGMTADTRIERFAFMDVIPGGRPELVVETSESNNDEDMGYCESTGGVDRRLVVCGTDDGTLRCASLALESTGYDVIYEGCEDDGGPAPSNENTGHSLDYAFSDGELRLVRRARSPEDVPEGMARTRSVAAWLASTDDGWPSGSSDD